jgi:hypothetical protein
MNLRVAKLAALAFLDGSGAASGFLQVDWQLATGY